MNLHKIAWEDSIWFSDIDDTLVSTAAITKEASEGVKRVFTGKFGEEAASRIQNNFNDIFNLIMLGLRNKTDKDWESFPDDKEKHVKLWQQLEECQREITAMGGSVKRFSREIFIKLAVEKEGYKTDKEAIYEAADYYWLLISEKTQPLPGVIELIQEIKKHNRPLYLVTGSDARLKLKDNGQFVYDSAYSENFKRGRIQLLREKGIDFNIVSIGDPEDKPHLDFFQKAIRLAEQDLGQLVNTANAIIMGDSFSADLQTPKEQMGFGLAALYQEGKTTTDIIDEHYLVTGNLLNIIKFIS